MARDLWYVPWATIHHPDAMARLKEQYPSDFVHAPKDGVYQPSHRIQGDQYQVGSFWDEWGCRFENIFEGIHGEVKNPILENIEDWAAIKPPYEMLPTDWDQARDTVNRFCAQTGQYVFAGCMPRPWERLQFIHGTEEALVDLLTEPGHTRSLLKVIHDFYMKELEFWTSTDVDAVFFMDDWGSQQQLLISPVLWREMFKPLYRDYCDIARANNKSVFMHSDGQISSIYPDLIEIGVSAVNSQIFCMDIENLARIAKGKITFWGEIDRQHVMLSTNPQDGVDAVHHVAKHLYSPEGGIIAQFEMTPGSNPDVAFAIYDAWEKISSAKAFCPSE